MVNKPVEGKYGVIVPSRGNMGLVSRGNMGLLMNTTQLPKRYSGVSGNGCGTIPKTAN